MDSDNVLLRILEWAWIALFAMFAALFRKVTGLETRQQLLDAQLEQHEKMRLEDKAARKESRDQVIEMITIHHKNIEQRIDTLETIIRHQSGPTA